ncbi:MAG: tetratricopeptide repeat protein [Verrucomicrobiota bacterium]
MKTKRVFGIWGLALAALLASTGCGPKKKEVTELQRKEAAHHASEAQFAVTVRDYTRAEASLLKAVGATPDDGELWVKLGATRVRLGNRDGAGEAYRSALKAYEADAAEPKAKSDPDPLLRQVYVLALLGRVDDARALVEKTAKKFPDNRNVKRFVEEKELDRIVTAPAFKEMAL